MGFKSNKVEIKGVSTDQVGTPITHNIELTEKEIEIILFIGKNSLFKGPFGFIFHNIKITRKV